MINIHTILKLMTKVQILPYKNLNQDLQLIKEVIA